MTYGIQIIATIFSLFMVYLALLNYRRGEINKTEFISWTMIWTATELTVLLPDIFRDFARRLLITRLFDFMIVCGFILVITMVARSYISTKIMEQKIEKLIRDDALNNAKKSSSKKN